MAAKLSMQLIIQPLPMPNVDSWLLDAISTLKNIPNLHNSLKYHQERLCL